MTEKRIQRRAGRVIALKTLFYYIEREERSLEECYREMIEEIEPQIVEDDFPWKIVKSAEDNMGKIKLIIRAFAPEFAIDKIAPINRALLILGINEMKFMETPPVVVINEYIELAKDFGEDKSPSFINGVLDSYRKSLGLERQK